MMKICLNDACKAENVDSAKFCSKCGTKFTMSTEKLNEGIEVVAPIAAPEESLEQSVENSVTTVDKKVRPAGQNLTKKKLAIIGAVLGGLAIIGAAIYFLASPSPIKKLEAAAESNDVDKFYDQIETVSNVHRDEEQYKQYLTSIGLPALYEQIDEGFTELKKSDNTSSTVFLNDEAVFMIEKKNKDFVIYSVPQEVYLSTENSDFTITFDDETYELSPNEELYLGEFLPGDFEYSVVADLGYMEAQQSKTFTVTASANNSNLVTLDLFEVDVYATYPSATLFINDQDTEMEISDFLNVALPVGATYKLSAQVVLGDEKYTSETIEVSDFDTISFSFEEHQDILGDSLTEQAAIDFIETFRIQFEEAINTINFGLISNYFVEGTELYRDYKQFIEDHAEFGVYNYNFAANEYKHFEGINMNTGTLTTFETFVYESSDEGKYLYEREKEYKIVYNPSKQSYEIEQINILDTKKTKQ